jgi:DNA repair protein SbcC/Rad50
MIPLHLRVSGFLSYCQPAELDFSTFELACISGSNGAGKSSLLDAITWALFGQARRKDDTVINSHASGAEVIFDFHYEGALYRVQRSKQANKATMLEFYVQDGDRKWRPLTEHSLRETELRIQKTLRMDYETFTNASFFLQGRADQFAQQRPGDRKRILSSILGLEIWDVYRDRATEQRRAQEGHLANLDTQLAEIDAELGQEAERKARLKNLEDTLEQLAGLRKVKETSLEQLRRLRASVDEQGRLVDMLANQLHAARQRLDNHTIQLDARRAERDTFREEIAAADEIETAYRTWQELRAQMERWDLVAADFRQYDAQRAAPLMAIETERTRLQQARQTLLEQAESAAAIEAQVPALQAAGQAAHQALELTSARMLDRPALEAELQALVESQAAAAAENKRLKDEMTELKERITTLRETSGALCPVCGQPLSPEERLKLVASLEVQGKELGDRYRRNQDLVKMGDERKRAISAALASLKGLEDELRQQQRTADQLEDRHAQAVKIVDNWRATGAVRLKELESVLRKEDFSAEARAELARINASLAQLGYDAAAHDAARQAEVAGRSSEGLMRALENARAALAPLEREIAGLEAQRASEQADADRLEASFTQADGKYRADLAQLPDLDQAETELFELHEQENRLRMQVGGARQAVEVLTSLRARHKEKAAQREAVMAQIARLKQLERAFGKDGVPALLIEQALPEIEAQANEILDRLTDGGMSVRFATQKDYKDKNRDDKKETLDILISDSAGWREYELFSGGEAFRVNFAIRLALSRVLAQRAGARLQTLVIDEGFGSQDAEGRQRLVEAINSVREDFARILVITHLEELKDAFPARIEVEKTPQGSQIKVVA